MLSEKQPALPVTLGWALRPKVGELRCGDACAAWQDEERLTLVVADGLGHGEGAEDAAQAALRCIEGIRQHPCEMIFDICDDRLRNTRGVALALAQVDRQLLTLATVGNIRAVLWRQGRDFHLGGARGIVGAGFACLSPEHLMLAAGDVLMLYSDGFPELLPLGELLGSAQEPVGLADAALKLWARPDDDASMLIYRHL